MEHVRALGCACEQGSENDVLERYVGVAKAHYVDVVVRTTGDYPLVDPELIDQCIHRFCAESVDYFSITNLPSYPDELI